MTTGGTFFMARQNGKRRSTGRCTDVEWLPMGRLEGEPILTVSTPVGDMPTLTREQMDALSGEVTARLTERGEEIWRRFEDAIMHGTNEQRQARTRALVRQSLSRERDANKEEA